MWQHNRSGRLGDGVLPFQVVTLPVEFDATARAKKLVVAYGIISERERVGMDRVLNAAALTYVAAVVSTLLTLLYFLMRAGFLREGGTTSGERPLPVAPADAGGARRLVARTAAMACVSAHPIGRRRLCAPRRPAWPIAPDSTHARDAVRESAHRSRLERWPRSMARDDHLGGPSAHSTTAETPWPRRESRARGAGERSSGCHRSPAAACASRIPNSLAASRLEATLRGA